MPACPRSGIDLSGPGRLHCKTIPFRGNNPDAAHRPPARETAPGAGLHHSICSAGPAAAARRWRRACRTSAVPVHGTRGGQPHRVGGRSAGRSQHLLRRGRFGRRLEVDRQRTQLRPDLRQPARPGDRRAGGGRFQSPDCLGGHRRGLGHPRQRHDGRRRLQINRRRAHLVAHGASGDRAHRADPHSPDQSGYRLRLRGGPPDRSAGRARRVQDHRRRAQLAARAVRESQHGVLRPVDGRHGSEHAGGRNVGSGDAQLGHVQRRAGQRRVPHARWRRDVEARRGARAAEIAGRQDRRSDRAHQFQAHLCPDPDRGPGVGLAVG